MEEFSRELPNLSAAAVRGEAVETQPGSPNFDGAAAYEAFLDAGGYGAQLVPKWAGQFDTHQQWINKAASWLKSPDWNRPICVDSLGRRMAIGMDMAKARDEGTFPVRYFWECELAPVSARAADAPSELSEPSFHVIVDEDGGPVFVTKLRQSAQEHINDACDVDVESAGKWKCIPVFEMPSASKSKPAAWIDQFGNVFPLGAYQPSGKPSYLDADKRGWKPLFRAADALDSQPTARTINYVRSEWESMCRKAVAVLNKHIVPDGISDHEALNELYGIFDSDEYRATGAIEQDACEARQAVQMNIDRSFASSQPTDGGVRNGPLMRFYAVETVQGLIDAQEQHIAKLQAKLPRDTQPAFTRVREG